MGTCCLFQSVRSTRCVLGPERRTRRRAFPFMPSTEPWRPVFWGQLGRPGPPRTAGLVGAGCRRRTHCVVTPGCSSFSNLLNLSGPWFPSVKWGRQHPFYRIAWKITTPLETLASSVWGGGSRAPHWSLRALLTCGTQAGQQGPQACGFIGGRGQSDGV